jgi:hypothetical protein
MSALEQEIVEKFRILDSSSKQRVLEILTQDAQTSFDYADWWEKVEVLQAQIRQRLGDQVTLGTLDLLDELREESP